MTSSYEIAVYYFPQYHADPRNDRWHGRNWTEWELVKAAKPRFPEHRQPIVPTWGYFDESDPTYAAREIDLAAEYGITSFLYDWYWHEEEGAFLQAGLERGFLQAANRERLKFAVMWANHDWTNIHPARFTNQPDLLAPGGLSQPGFEKMTDYIIEHYFSQPNYLLIDGAPYFSIYELGTFLGGIGGLEEARAALTRFQEKTKAAGFPGLHLNGVVWGFSVLPGEVKITNPAELVSYLGFASTTTYAWAHHYDFYQWQSPQVRFADVAESNYAAWEMYKRQMPVPYYPNVSMGWDPSPRTIHSDKYEPRGYPWTSIIVDNTPAAFKAALQEARKFMDHSNLNICTINAWNEWTEGSYLLPDTLNGMAYLEAIRDVFCK